MARNIPLTTIGVRVGYAVGSSDEAPAVYTRIHGFYSTPDFNVSPSTVDTTSFENETYTSNTALLRQLPDTLEFGARFGKTFANEWETVVSAYNSLEDSEENPQELWFAITVPGYEKAICFPGKPLDMGLPALEANNNIDINVYISPTGEPSTKTGVTVNDSQE